MALRRSRRLAGLAPEVFDDLPVGKSKEKLGASFTGTVIGMVVMTSAVVFMTFWK